MAKALEATIRADYEGLFVEVIVTKDELFKALVDQDPLFNIPHSSSYDEYRLTFHLDKKAL